ncbi:MAG: alpha/beta hydrolase fold domain-containing protein [Planctomycetes bacterium]|nr:alpha/beta hydrolase fold domain-containing protein [Planctomycetota bacterium]
MKRLTGLCTLLMLTAVALGADDPLRPPEAQAMPYKTIDGTTLNLYLYKPADWQASDHRPVIVFFFGGGWKAGSPRQFEHQCEYFASRGMVAITADYRVASRQNVKAVDCVTDAKSAIRFVRAHAAQLGVDPNRIVASGGSAGGHIAACTGVIDKFDDTGEEATVSSKPNAMVLFNPAAALAPFEGSPKASEELIASLRDRCGVEPVEISPAHHIHPGVVPTIIFFGTDDSLLSGGEYFTKQMIAAGNRCELRTWPGMKHGFFNFGRNDNKPYVETLDAADRFLASLGYLAGEPTIKAP